MLPRKVDELLARLTDRDLVLDVGGWACPFNRAQYVLDAEPYETRGFYRTICLEPYQGGEKEWFTRDTWVQRDICDRTPWPFVDKQFDLVICSHTLEDIRDPIWVCSELVRVAKRGYIEVPSREWESCRGLERPGQVGLSHHRWLIDISEQHLTFLAKYHMIHAHWRFSLPNKHFLSLPPERCVQWLEWENSFTFAEKTIHGVQAMEDELSGYVQRIRPYSALALRLDRWYRGGREMATRVKRRIGRLLW
jgi:Methyltransferase domain